MKMRRARRRQNSPVIFSRYQKTANLKRSDSPDSLLKLKLESTLYETFERVPVSPHGRGCVEGKHAQYETHLGCLESIRRGPDGRFVVQREPGSDASLPGPPSEGYPRPAPPDPCPQAQGVWPWAPLRPKARGQAWGRPRACYFAAATTSSSSPIEGSQPPLLPDLSPIPRPPASRFGPELELGPVAKGGLGLRLSRPGPPEEEEWEAPLGLRPAGPGLGPTRAGLVCSSPQGPRLPGGGGPQASGRCRPDPERPLPRGPAGQRPFSSSSEAAGSSPAPNSSGYHSGDVSWRVWEERSRDRRESREGGRDEWEAGMAMSSEILEALRLHRRTRRPHSSIALHDLSLT
ncbi:uncharacterized protein LOC144677073, partial [Cetorhinus maximus]